MNSDEATPREEQLAALLADFDEALATGTPPPGAAAPDELRSRLEEDLECLQLLHHLRPGPPAGVGPDTAGPGARYTRAHLHAVGGLGRVWRAHDPDLGRDIALKELRPERARDPGIAARFLREARITGQLQHPGIVPVYEVVPDGPGAGRPFYTMRFIQGRTLTEAARAYHEKRAAGRAGPLDQAALLNAFVSACQTVAYAHSRGVIHRDLKGPNVVLGDFGEVMVLDWGFAKLRGDPADGGAAAAPDAAAPADQTLLGQVVGTPAYMAPEQAAGRGDLIDERTDVYGLGAILYELLTGRPPFTGPDAAEVLRQVREGEPPRPGAVCPGVPPALAVVCLRALARDPARRYPSAAALGGDVQRWLADEPVTAYRAPLAARLRRWARHHKPVLAGLVALLATGLAALLVCEALFQQGESRMVALRAQATAEKANVETRARQALESRLYYHRIALAERELAANNRNRAAQVLEDCPAGLRGWEWHCLERLCHADALTLRGHDGAVAAVAFSPDGRHLASAGHDGTVRVWEVAGGRAVRTLAGHADAVYGVAYSPDGRRLATASWDHTVKVWDAADGRELFACRGHEEKVWRVAFSPDGRLLASLSHGKVILWDAATGEEVRTLGQAGDPTRYGLAFGPDGRQLAVTIQSAVVLWDVATGREAGGFRGHSAVVKNVAFSPDGRLVASGAGDLVRNDPGEVKVWEPESGREVYSLRGHTDPIYGVAFSPDGRRLVSASEDQTVKVWDLGTGQEALTIRAHADTVRAVAFSPDGTRLATADAAGIIKLWDANPWADERPAGAVRTLTGAGARVFSVAFHPDGRRLVAAGDNQTLTVWDVLSAEGRPEQRVPTANPVSVAAYSPDGGLLATVYADGAVWLLDPATGDAKRVLAPWRMGPVRSLAFRRDGRRLAVASWDRTVHVWDVEAGRLAHVLEGHADAVTGVAYSPDGRLIASCSHDQTVRVWDAEAGRLVRTLCGHTSRVNGVAFSPDGRLLASASNDGAVRLWDPATGRAGRVLRGHASGVFSVAFSPDGTRLASAGNDWTVKLWDPAAGAEVGTLRGHTDRVHAVAFSPDGKHLASASSDQTVKVWEVK